MLKQLLMLTANVSKIKGSVLSNIISYKENCLLGNKKKILSMQRKPNLLKFLWLSLYGFIESKIPSLIPHR